MSRFVVHHGFCLTRAFLVALSVCPRVRSVVPSARWYACMLADPSGCIIDRPYLSYFREGLTVLVFFISTLGARLGLAVYGPLYGCLWVSDAPPCCCCPICHCTCIRLLRYDHVSRPRTGSFLLVVFGSSQRLADRFTPWAVPLLLASLLTYVSIIAVAVFGGLRYTSLSVSLLPRSWKSVCYPLVCSYMA